MRSKICQGALLVFVLTLVWGCSGSSDPTPPVKILKSDDLGLAQALWTASSDCDHEAINKLIKSGANVNAVLGPRRTTPLMEAVRAYDNKCPKEIAEILVADGAVLNKQDRYGYTVLHWLASRNCVEPYVQALHFLLEKGADPTIRDYQCRTPLELAAEQSCIEKMRTLAIYTEKNKDAAAMRKDPCLETLPGDKPKSDEPGS